MTIKSLAQITMEALDFFIAQAPKKISPKTLTPAIIVGSGNAYHTGQLIFSREKAIFASESDFRLKAKTWADKIKNAVIISASGEKDSVWETKLAKELGYQTTLLTCLANSAAAKIAQQTIVYKRIAEPYTYNTSTYMGMLIGASNEKAKDIKAEVKKIRLPKNIDKYDSYSFVLPDELAPLAAMLEIKGRELFGSFLNIKAYTLGEARHAKFIHDNKKELIISLGQTNQYFGQNRLNININLKSKPATAMAISYYIIGKIQEKKPQYFNKNIKKYCQKGGIAYAQKQNFPLIVEKN
jgi:hypothetical protein